MEETPRFEFIVGDCAGVFVSTGDRISISVKAWLCKIDGSVEVNTMDPACDLIEIGPVTPEQSYMLGKALLAAAKTQGIGE